MNFPDSFRERMNSVLSCTNSEAKNLTLLCLGKSPKTRYELKREIDGIVKDSWSPSPQTINEYFDCFSHYNAIEEGNTLTDAGKKYFQPIAAFTIKFAVENGFSLYSVFGKLDALETEYGPYDRYRILRELEICPQRTIDISRKLNEYPANVGRRLDIMKGSGVVEYKSVSGIHGPGYSRYSWVNGSPENVEPTGKRPLLVMRASKIMHDLKTFTRTDLAKCLGYKDPPSLSKIIKEVREQGFVEPLEFMAQNVQSRANLTSFGETVFMKSFLDKITHLLKDEAHFDEMNQALEAFEKDPKMFKAYANKALDLYSKVSPGIRSWETRMKKLNHSFK